MQALFMPDKGNRIIRNTFTANMIAFILSSLTSSVGSLIDGVVIGQFLGVDAMAAFAVKAVRENRQNHQGYAFRQWFLDPKPRPFGACGEPLNQQK